MTAVSRAVLEWVEHGMLPDAVIRAGIRRLCESRLAEVESADAEAASRRTEAFAREMDSAPIALLPELANAQHYEVPERFFGLVLGPRRKYSSAFWPAGTRSLADAESAGLSATCEYAGIADGQTILELGCGWGSLTRWMAEHYPASRIIAVSNSRSQREWILRDAAARGLRNIDVVTADMNEFESSSRFDRVVSVEMFEHMRNWRRLFGRVADWLEPDGRFYMHVFCHRSTPYAFEDRGPGDWMGRHFFSGGMMPSDDLALRFQDRLGFRSRWRWDGSHYRRTAEAWLANLDACRAEATDVLAAVHGPAEAAQWLQRWRIFFMACAELFGFRDGQEWWVSHFLFDRAND